MALFYDKSELTSHVEAMFARMARSHPDPSIQGPERPVEVGIVHEYSNLADATVDNGHVAGDKLKPRVVIISAALVVTGQTIFHVHKGRRNRDASVQVGRTWKLEELATLDAVPTNARVLVLGFRKPYFWVFGSAEQRQEFERALRYCYKELTGRLLSESAPPPVPSVSRKRTVSSPRPPAIATPQLPLTPSAQQQQPPLAPLVAPLRHHPSQASHESSSESLPTRSPLRTGSIPPLSQKPSQRSMHSPRALPKASPTLGEGQLQPSLFPDSNTLPSSMSEREQRYIEESARQAEAARNSEVAQDEQARQRQAFQEEQARHQQGLREQQALQEQARREQARQEQARQEQARQEQAMHEQARQEQARQEQARQEQAMQEQARQEQLRQEQARQEQIRQEQAREEQTRQDQARHEQARLQQARQEQEQLRQEQLRQEQLRQDQLHQEQLRQEQELNDTEPTSRSPPPPHLKLKTHHLNKLAQEQLQQWEQPSTPTDPHFVPDFTSPGSISPEPELRALTRAARGQKKPPGGSAQPTKEEVMRHDLMLLFDEFKWTGNNVGMLEQRIQERLDGLSDQTFANVVDLDSQLDEIDGLVSESIKECNTVDEKMQAVAMNLAGVGDEIAHIQGQGDGLQITAVNYQRLASEIESLLSTVTLPPSVTQSIRAPDFGEPGTGEAATKLVRVEDLLLELYRAVKVSSLENESGGGLGSMRVLKERGSIIGETASDFGNKFSRFILKWVDDLTRSAPPLDGSYERSLEVELVNRLYAYCGCMLFLKESSARTYRALYKEYQRILRSFYEKQFSTYVASWLRQIEQTAGKRASIQLHATEGFGSNRKSKNAEEFQGANDHSGPGSTGVSSLALPSDKVQQLYSYLTSFIDQLCFHVSAQQRFLLKFFVLGDEGNQQFDAFVVQQQPLPKGRLREQQQLRNKILKMDIQGIDTSESASYAVLTVLRDRIFLKLGEIASDAVMTLTKTAIFESVYMATVLDLRLNILRKSSQQYLTSLLERLFKTISNAWDEISKQQTRSILSAQYITKKRVGVLPVVARFTEHISIVERSITAALLNERERGNLKSDYEGETTRTMVDKSHETLFRAIAQGFQLGSTPTATGHQTAAARLKAAARETAGSAVTGEEAKELLNRHVVMIENMNKIVTELERFGSVGVQRIVLNAKQHYNKEVESYAHAVFLRPFGRIITFLSNYDAQPNQSPKEVTSNLKRSLNGFDSKEFRKSTESLRKRVEKHFAGADPNLQQRLWHALGSQFATLYQRVQRIAQQHDATNYLEISSSDVSNAFR